MDSDPTKDTLTGQRSESRRWLTSFDTIAKLVGAVAAIIGIIGFFAFRKETQSLVVTLDRPVELLSTPLVGRFQSSLTVNQIAVSSPFVVTGEISNEGQKPIRREDVEQSLRFIVPSARPIGASIVSTSPPGVEASTHLIENGIEIHHGLLNPGDRIGFQFLADGKPTLPEVSCRIANVSQIIIQSAESERKPRPPFFIQLPRWLDWLFLGSAILWSIIALGGILKLAARGPEPNEKALDAAAFDFVSPSRLLRAVAGKITHPELRRVAEHMSGSADFDLLRDKSALLTALRAVPSTPQFELEWPRVEDACDALWNTLQTHAIDSIVRIVEAHPHLSQSTNFLNSIKLVRSNSESLTSAIAQIYESIKKELRRLRIPRPSYSVAFGHWIAFLTIFVTLLPFFLMTARAFGMLLD